MALLIDEVRAMTDDEIREEIENRRQAIYNYRFQQASGQLADTNAISKTRREIARLMTILGERQRAEAEGKSWHNAE